MKLRCSLWLVPFMSSSASSLLLQNQQRRWFVSWHGHTPFPSKTTTRRSLAFRVRENEHQQHVIPPNPHTLLSESQLQSKVQTLFDWLSDKKHVLCLTGAGLSTESGIPDYRGNNGSYHKGHKPLIHHHFMTDDYQRKRYWGRGIIGWKFFDSKRPNAGHEALARLEWLGRIGVLVDDRPDYYQDPSDYDSNNYTTNTNGTMLPLQRRVSIITQNVDSFHQQAGCKHVVNLHGSLQEVVCMNCGAKRGRHSFHSELEELNRDWLQKQQAEAGQSNDSMRADGDAAIEQADFNEIVVPSCDSCGIGFFKPDVVLFGDTVPASRVALCRASVEAADGILVVGSSLAVHSAYRHVRTASQLGIPIAILNVGETRAEAEGLDVLKIEAPAGQTLSLLASRLS